MRLILPGRSAYHHLLALAQTNGIARSRVDEVVEQVGLREVVRRRAGRFSLGMGQRLGIAAVVRVRSTDPDALAARLRSREVAVSPDGDGALTVSGLSTDEVGRVAGAAGITLLELTAQQASLEEAFMDLTRDAVEFRAPATTGADNDHPDPASRTIGHRRADGP
jgi:hypothetical protein